MQICCGHRARTILLCGLFFILLTAVPVMTASADSGVNEHYESDNDFGWRKVGKKWFYYDESDRMVKGWLWSYDDNVYYLDKTGERVSGFWTIGKDTYYFDGEGRLQTGWVKLKKKRYYFQEGDEDADIGEIGKARTGWYVKDGKRYHFAKDGELAVGETKIGKAVYYFKKSGEQRLGWVNAGNGSKRYYYTQSDKGKKWGRMAANTTYKNHYFAKNGLTSKTMTACKKILDQVGWNLRSAYNWSAGLSYSGREIYLESWGSEKLAQQGFERHSGNCYVMAATFYEMAQCMGYDAHQIAGAVPSRRGGLTNHSWVEIVEDGQVWVYDPNCTMETGVDRFHFRYGTPGTWRYSEYHRMN